VNAIAVALQGKGLQKLAQRGTAIIRHYGWTSRRMDRSLARLVAILDQFGCAATFPITAIVAQRHPQLVRRYQERGIEFAIHGHRHVDHSVLAAEAQLAELAQAQEAFSRAGILVSGFRCPYLRWNEGTLGALRQQGLTYDSSQALAWDVLDGLETPAYLREVSFCGALPAAQYPSLPRLTDNLVRIPYSLPDDEGFVDRLALEMPAHMSDLWLKILHRTHQLGELFTIGLHPERAELCEEPLAATLAQARALTPPVWVARLCEISTWWQARSNSSVLMAGDGNDGLRIEVMGPPGVTILARGVKTDIPAMPWMDGYARLLSNRFAVSAPIRPCIGVSVDTSSRLVSFLREQGYVVEVGKEKAHYSHYIDQAQFVAEHERPLLAEIEGAGRPLVRLGRWPDGARSALAVTGDIDAFTWWDFGLRFLGR